MKERDLKAEQELELRKKAVRALEEHYQEISDRCNFNAEAIPGYVVVAYIDSVREDLMLDIYQVKELIKCYIGWQAEAHAYWKEQRKQGNELDFEEALYKTRGEWFDRELYKVCE